MRIQITYSAIARPQGRGKIERLFGVINTELLPKLPGQLISGKSVSPPKLSVTKLDAAVGEWIIGTYNHRLHSETGTSPVSSWCGQGWLPNMPGSLNDLDLLLVMVAKPRIVRRDGVHFQGLRFMSPILAPYVGETVTIRYDPRDFGEIQVFHNNRFLCRDVSPDRAHEIVTLKDIQMARSAHRRALRTRIKERVGAVSEYLPESTKLRRATAKPAIKRHNTLRTYEEDD